MKYRMVQTAACTLLALTTVGCLSPRTDLTETQTYRLSIDGLRDEARHDRMDGPVLLVSPPQAEPGFETQRMVYIRRPYQLEYYAVNQWVDAPARMFAPLMVHALNDRETWRAVLPLPSSVPGDYRLDTYGFLVQQEFLQQPSRVRITARMQLVDLNASMILGTRAFEAVEPAPSENAYGGVLAANRAVAGLLDQIATWLRQCVRHSPECDRSDLERRTP